MEQPNMPGIAMAPTEDSKNTQNAAVQIEFSNASRAIRELRENQRKTERLVLIMALVFVICISGVVVFTNTDAVSGAWDYLQSFENAGSSKNRAANCADPRNKYTVYCVERAAQNESDWRGIVRNDGGKAAAFAVHGK